MTEEQEIRHLALDAALRLNCCDPDKTFEWTVIFAHYITSGVETQPPSK